MPAGDRRSTCACNAHGYAARRVQRERRPVMAGKLVRTTSMLIALLGGTGLVFGQQPSPAPEPQQKIQQQNSQQTPSGQSGKEEPSSHAPAAKPPDGAVLVDGALAVPGAAATDMVPAKFSEKHAADDKLITIAYTFKTLTD